MEGKRKGDSKGKGEWWEGGTEREWGRTGGREGEEGGGEGVDRKSVV